MALLYWLLHNLLGSLPMTDEFLVEENIEVPEVTELAEGGQVIGFWEDSLAFKADGDVAEPAATTTANRNAIPDPASPPSCSVDGPAGDLNSSAGEGKNNDASAASKLATGRKRPATVVQTLLARHTEEMLHVRKSEKKRRKLMKKFVQLQAKAIGINASMMRMMAKYFESRTNGE
nr:uncharacterized protein LOC129388002 [Dermacentor andersoni]